MNNATQPNRYSNLSIALHWIMLLLLAAVYACMELHESFPKGSDLRNTLKTWHFMLGIVVFVLAWLRIVARVISPTPPIQPTPPAWQSILAKLMHLALYALMIAMPLGGWLMINAAGKPVPFFGFELPILIGEDKALGKQIHELHETFGVIGYWLIALHTVAAIYHHRVMKDDTMLRMLPGRNG